MKFLFSLVLAALLSAGSIISNAQPDVTVRQSKPLDPEKNAKFNSILGVDDESFYVLCIKTRGIGTKYFVERYDKKTLSLIYSADLLLDEVKGSQTDPAKFTINSFATPGKVYVFFKALEYKDKEKVFYVKSVDKNGIVSAEKEVGRLLTEHEGYFSITVSPDRSRIAVITDVREKDKPQTVNAVIFDSKNLNQERKIKLPQEYGKGGMYCSNYIIENQSNFYFTFNYLTSKDEVGLALGALPVNSPGLKAVELILSPKNELYNGMIKFNTHDNTVVVAGMYKQSVKSDGKTKDQPETKLGMYSFKIGIDKFNILKKSEKGISHDIYQRLDYEDAMVTRAPGGKYYSAEKILEMGNDNYFVATHSFTMSYSNGGSYSISKEILVTKINNAGEIEWMKIIPRNTSYSSIGFNTVSYNDKIHFFFLEHPKNSEKFPDPENYDPEKYKPVSGVAGPNAVCISLDPVGKLQKKIFYTNKDYGYIPTTDDYLIEEPNGLLIRFADGDREKFGVVTVK